MPEKLVDLKENLEELSHLKIKEQRVTWVFFYCEQCKKRTEVNYENWKRRSGVFICGKCKYKNNIIENYGSEKEYFKRRQNKIEENNIKKYGVKNVFQLEKVQEKAKNTIQTVYEHEFAQSSDIVKQRQKETWKKNLGVSTPFKSKACREKSEKTCLKKYGVSNAMKSSACIQKRVENTFKKYGVSHTSMLKETQTKRKETLKKIYGENAFSYIGEKSTNTRIERYGSAVCVKRYFYENEYFDSTWEIAFFIKMGGSVKRNYSKYFEYTANSRVHKYFPDFYDNFGNFYEVKGDHMIKENSLCTPSGEITEVLKQKYLCMMRNHVKIITSSELQDVFEKFPRDYFKQFKTK